MKLLSAVALTIVSQASAWFAELKDWGIELNYQEDSPGVENTGYKLHYDTPIASLKAKYKPNNRKGYKRSYDLSIGEAIRTKVDSIFVDKKQGYDYEHVQINHSDSMTGWLDRWESNMYYYEHNDYPGDSWFISNDSFDSVIGSCKSNTDLHIKNREDADDAHVMLKHEADFTDPDGWVTKVYAKMDHYGRFHNAKFGQEHLSIPSYLEITNMVGITHDMEAEDNWWVHNIVGHHLTMELIDTFFDYDDTFEVLNGVHLQYTNELEHGMGEAMAWVSTMWFENWQSCLNIADLDNEGECVATLMINDKEHKWFAHGLKITITNIWTDFAIHWYEDEHLEHFVGGYQHYPLAKHTETEIDSHIHDDPHAYGMWWIEAGEETQYYALGQVSVVEHMAYWDGWLHHWSTLVESNLYELSVWTYLVEDVVDHYMRLDFSKYPIDQTLLHIKYINHFVERYQSVAKKFFQLSYYMVCEPNLKERMEAQGVYLTDLGLVSANAQFSYILNFWEWVIPTLDEFEYYGMEPTVGGYIGLVHWNLYTYIAWDIEKGDIVYNVHQNHVDMMAYCENLYNTIEATFWTSQLAEAKRIENKFNEVAHKFHLAAQLFAQEEEAAIDSYNAIFSFLDERKAQMFQW